LNVYSKRTLQTSGFYEEMCDWLNKINKSVRFIIC